MLTQKSLTQLNVTDQVLNRSFDNVAAALNPVLQTPILDGVLVSGLLIPTSGKLVVPHGLGRTVRGWFITSVNNSVSLPYALSADQKAPNGSLVLTFASGAGATVSFWVF